VVLGNTVEGIPFLDDLGDDLRFSHFGELVLVLVVLLARKLTIHLPHHFLLLILTHEIQKLNYISLTAAVKKILYFKDYN
jgi:hypothetical protein